MFVDPESKVIIVGYYDFPSRMAKQTSDLFSTNMYNLIEELLEIPLNKGNNVENFKINPDDEIQRGMIIFSNGEYIAPKVAQPAPPKPAAQENKPATTTIELTSNLVSFNFISFHWDF